MKIEQILREEIIRELLLEVDPDISDVILNKIIDVCENPFDAQLYII